MAGGKPSGPRCRRGLARFKEEALASVEVLAGGLWPAAATVECEKAENAVLRSRTWSEVAAVLRGWENEAKRDAQEDPRDLRAVVHREFGIPCRQLREDQATEEEPWFGPSSLGRAGHHDTA